MLKWDYMKRHMMVTLITGNIYAHSMKYIYTILPYDTFKVRTIKENNHSN
jgi:hypothetical protein